MLLEPFTDPQGQGDAWVCIQCSERLEKYTNRRSWAMSKTEIDELRGTRARQPGWRPSGADQAGGNRDGNHHV